MTENSAEKKNVNVDPKMSIKERVEQERAIERKKAGKRIVYTIVPASILLILLVIFWSHITFAWSLLSFKYGEAETRIAVLEKMVKDKDKGGKKYFLEALDGNIFERNVGLRGLRFAGDNTICNKMFTIYNDKTDTYRDKKTGETNREIAVELIATYGGNANMDFFLGLLSEGNPWWNYGMEYLLEHAEEPFLQILMEMLESKDKTERFRASMAIFWLRKKDWVKNNPDVVKAAAKHCKDENPSVRRWACKTLAALDGENSVDLIIERLNDEDKSVIQDAAESLGDIGDEKAVEGLLKLLREPDFPSSAAAQISLIKIKSFKPVKGIFEIARDSTLERENRLGALQVLPRLIDKEGKSALLLKEVQLELLDIIRAVDPDSSVETSEDLAVRIEAASIVYCSVSGCPVGPLRSRPPSNVTEEVMKAWADDSVRKKVFETFLAENHLTVKNILISALAETNYPSFSDFLINWAPKSRYSERKLIGKAFSILTVSKEFPDGTDFGFNSAQTGEQLKKSISKAEKWLASKNKPEQK